MRIRPLETITRPGLWDCDVSPDGQAVAAPYREDDGLRLGVWSTAGCNPLLSLDLPGPYTRPRFAQRGGRLAAAREGEEVTVWSLTDGRRLYSRTREGGAPISGHAFGHGGETLAVAQGDRVSLFEIEGGAYLATVAAPAEIGALRSSPDGQLLAVGLRAGGVLVVDLEARETVATLPGIEQPVVALSFHPREPWILAATAPSFAQAGEARRRLTHGWAHIQSYRTGEEIARIPCDYQAVLVGEGRYVATLTNNSRNLWFWQIVPDVDIVAHIENVAPELAVERTGQETRQVTLAATPSGDLLAVAGLARPVSAAGVLRLYAIQPEAAPQPQP
jgi:WD40 repeat protein